MELRSIERDSIFTVTEEHSLNAVDVSVEGLISEKHVIPDFAQVGVAAEGDVSTAVVFFAG